MLAQLAPRPCLPLLRAWPSWTRCAKRQMAAKEKPRYDGTWRPEPGKPCRPCPKASAGAALQDAPGRRGAWDDKCKGRIEFQNSELDDLVIARPDGPPATYNFCVCVDAWTWHHPRHPRRRPCQQHAAPDPHLRSLGAGCRCLPTCPPCLNEQGEKMSKRNGAKAVTQYRDEGYLPDAMVNYLARLGWSHGDDEIFSRAQFLGGSTSTTWAVAPASSTRPSCAGSTPSTSKPDDDFELARAGGRSSSGRRGPAALDERLPRICACSGPLRNPGRSTDWVRVFYLDSPSSATPRTSTKHVAHQADPLCWTAFAQPLQTVEWSKGHRRRHQAPGRGAMKMPQLAMPVRVLSGHAHKRHRSMRCWLLGREKFGKIENRLKPVYNSRLSKHRQINLNWV